MTGWTRKTAMLASGLAMSAAVVLGGGQTASAAESGISTRSVSIEAPSPCTTWVDGAGPGGAMRVHAKCPGHWVMVHVWCNNGDRLSQPHWRNGYNKAECPRGGRASRAHVYLS